MKRIFSLLVLCLTLIMLFSCSNTIYVEELDMQCVGVKVFEEENEVPGEYSFDPFASYHNESSDYYYVVDVSSDKTYTVKLYFVSYTNKELNSIFMEKRYNSEYSLYTDDLVPEVVLLGEVNDVIEVKDKAIFDLMNVKKGRLFEVSWTVRSDYVENNSYYISYFVYDSEKNVPPYNSKLICGVAFK